MDTQSNHTDTAVRGRPRDTALHQRVLNEAFALAQENGYQKVTVKEIAKRSKVSRQTIYRRWPTKQALFLEVIREQFLRSTIATPSQTTDLELYLCRLFEMARNKTGDILLGILMATEQDSWFFSDVQQLINERRFLLERVIEQDALFRRRSYQVPVSVIAEMLAASMWYRVLYKGSLDDAFAHTLMHTVKALEIKEGG
jgi:AcrR family transcriptional regulator